MDETEKLELVLEIGSSDATVEELDGLTRQLLRDLQETDVESAELVSGVATAGTKSGDVVTIGSIAITVLPALLPKIVETIQAWLLRGSNRTVKFKGMVNGHKVDFEGAPDDLHKLIATLEKKGKKKK